MKRWTFPPLIKARASSTNCTMGNLATQHTYIQSMLNLPIFISFLLCKSLIFTILSASCHTRKQRKCRKDECCCWNAPHFISNRHFIWPSDVKAGLDVFLVQSCPSLLIVRGRRGRDPMVVGFTATYITSTYHH